MTVQNILDYLFTLAPVSYQESWDNVGFLVGRKDALEQGDMLIFEGFAAK